MAFNKIQPEQIQLATFFSSSGDISIDQTDTGVGLNLSRGITGDFLFTGDGSRPFKVNNRQVLLLTEDSNSDYTFESGSFAINGSNNTLISGTNNVAINSNQVSISGEATSNTSINGKQQVFGSGVENCFAVGEQATFTTATTGAVVFSDFNSNTSETKGDHTFLVDFSSGSYFEGGDTYHLNNINVRDTSSGLFSGDLNVLGDTFMGSSTVISVYSGQTPVAQSGSIMVSGSKVAVHVGGSWVGITTESL
jgi:hypothetical protein